MKVYIRSSVDSKNLKHFNYFAGTTNNAKVMQKSKDAAQHSIDSGAFAACYCVVLPSGHSAKQLRTCNFEAVVGNNGPIFTANSLSEYQQKVDQFCEGIPERYFHFLTLFNDTEAADNPMFSLYNQLCKRYSSEAQVTLSDSNFNEITFRLLPDTDISCYISYDNDKIIIDSYGPDSNTEVKVSSVAEALSEIDTWFRAQSSDADLIDIRNAMHDILVHRLDWSSNYADDCVSGVYPEMLEDIDELRDYIASYLKGYADDEESAYDQADEILKAFRNAHIL